MKNAKRIKSKALKAEEIAKSTLTLQDIDIFDLILTCEDRQFSEFEKFLQHFQQCQHLYRKSDLLILLFICLWDFAFDIWYDKQSITNLASLCEWIEILFIDFVVVAFAKSKINCSKINCMRCDSNFNFKKKLRKHVREQHAKKLINNSFFSINTSIQFSVRRRKEVSFRWLICLVDFAKIWNFYCNIKVNIRVNNDFRNSHFIENLAFLI